ncbi:hypothetical protein NL50_11875 [Clostridium acetobutylicum]|nr:hypothetical protein NL50_11875 [Clostridium acetobutylicum]
MLKDFIFKNKKPLIAAFLVILIIFYIDHRINLNKLHDITYAADYYMTSGVFNTHKLYKVDSYNLKFSSNDESILFVSGIESKSPHKTITYKLTMLRNSSGIWRLKHIEQANPLN